MIFKVELTKAAQKDLHKLRAAKLADKALRIRDLLAINPYDYGYEKLSGDLAGQYSRRINIKHRLVYEIFEDTKIIKILSMWSHYE